MKKPSKAAIARENLSRLASIGVGSMYVEDLRIARRDALDLHRVQRRAGWVEEFAARDMSYSEAVRRHKNARARLQREVKRYRKWLTEVLA